MQVFLNSGQEIGKKMKLVENLLQTHTVQSQTFTNNSEYLMYKTKKNKYLWTIIVYKLVK